MFVSQLATNDARVELIKPDVERDARLSLAWLADPIGRETLHLMGVSDEDNHASTLEEEQERVRGFLGDNGELDWMIQLDGRVVGAIWVHIHSTDEIAAPTISLMIGDPKARGHGVGRTALQTIIQWLQRERGERVVYARHLVENHTSANLLRSFNFVNDGETYIGADGLNWQNVKLLSTE